MFEQGYAVAASLIWAFSPIYYRTFLSRFDFVTLNLVRTSTAAIVLALPAAYYYGGGGGWVYHSILSGVITLAVGDSLFLLAIRETGASVASPVVYTYVFMVQITATSVGESVPAASYFAAVLIVAGVFVLSRGGRSRPRRKGIVLGLAAAVAWTVGQDVIRLATGGGGSAVAIAFVRNLAAAGALGGTFLLTRRSRPWPARVRGRELALLAAVAATDLALGSVLFVYSISLVGVALTVILTSISPLLTQVLARAMGREAPSLRDYLGGAMVVAAVVMAVVL